MAGSRKAREEEEEEQLERFVVLLRHGIAEDPVEGKTDEERSLSPEGHARMKQVARGLERAFPKAQVIYASPLLRAVQTALWISKGYRSRVKVNTTDALIPGADPKELIEFLAGMKERRIFLVGHEPHLSETMMELAGLTAAGQIELKKGGCYGVRIYSDGTAAVEWLLSPRILRKLSEIE